MIAWPERWRTPVSRIRETPSGVDGYGYPLPGTVEETVLPSCLFAPAGSQIPIEEGVSSMLDSPTAYWPDQWPDVRGSDRLRIGGEVWHITARPALWPMGLVVTLSRESPIGETNEVRAEQLRGGEVLEGARGAGDAVAVGGDRGDALR